MLKNDKWIKEQAGAGMIAPFIPSLVRTDERGRVISYGLSSYGYDLRLSNKEFRIFRHVPGQVVDPKQFHQGMLEATQLHTNERSQEFFIPPAIPTAWEL